MRSSRPSNWAQYASSPMPNTPTRARRADRGRRAARSMPEVVCVIESAGLEVELRDVLLVEGGQGPEHDLAVLADRVLAEPPGGERLARLAGDAPGHERGGGLAGQVADVLGHPELELVDGPVLDELAHLVREAEPR